MIRADVKTQVTQDFSQERANDNLGSVVGDDNDSTISIHEGIVASLAALPLKARRLSNLPELPVGDQAELSQTETSTRHVPTKSGNGSSGDDVFR